MSVTHYTKVGSRWIAPVDPNAPWQPYNSVWSPWEFTTVQTYDDHMGEMEAFAEQQAAEIAAERYNEAVLVYGQHFWG